MKKILVGLALALLSFSALAADNGLQVTNGAGPVLRSKDVGVGVQAPSAILVDQTGVFMGAFSNFGTTPGAVPVPGVNASIIGTPAVSQSGTWNIGTVTTVTTITNPVAATQSGAWTTNPTTPANWALAATAAAVPANAIYNAMNVGGTLTGLTGTGTSLNVNCTAGCAGSGGTSSSFGSAFPATGTAIGLATTSPSTGNMTAWAATTNYGTAPAAIPVPGVNAFVTNAATAGRTTTGLNAQGASPVVQPSAPNTATGGTPFPIVNATSSANATLIKNTPTVVFACQLGNNSTAIAYLHIFNKATAPTPGTDTAVKTLIIPAPAAGGGGSNVSFGPGGFALATGFGITITAGIGTVDNTTIATANQVVVNCDFE